MKTKLRFFMVAFGAFLVAARADTPPQIVDPPLTQFAWAGGPMTLQVSITNKTAVSYQWQVLRSGQINRVDLPGATNKTYHLSRALDDSGDYRVVVSNSAGSVISPEAHLTVRPWGPAMPTGVSFVDLSELDASLRDIMQAHEVPGASLVIMKDGRLIAARGYGYADPETYELVQPESLFRIASLSKAITATAVLKLVEEGRLNLDDPVFPSLSLPPPTFPGGQLDPRLTNITVRHLLNHTGGWDRDTAKNPEGGIGFNPNTWFKRCAQDLGISENTTGYSIPTPRDMAHWMTGFPLQSKPGTAFHYSNVGYMVAGDLIEQLRGSFYVDSIRQLLASADITRIRMASSELGGRAGEEVVHWLSPLYNVRAENTPVRYALPPSVTSDIAYYFPAEVWPAAGGLATTPMDYARFISTIDGNPTTPDILTTNSLKTMLTVTPQSRTGGEPYGMGWDIDESTGEISHGGDTIAANALAVRRKDGVVYVVFCSTRDDTLLGELKATLDSAVSAIKTWPTNDLFPATISYEAWRTHYFTSNELNSLVSNVALDDADPDGDGLSNITEYALGLNPRVADHDPWLRGRLIDEGGETHFALEFRRRPLGRAVQYIVEVSKDLKTWIEPSEAPDLTGILLIAKEELEADGMVRVRLVDYWDKSVGTSFFRVTVGRIPSFTQGR